MNNHPRMTTGTYLLYQNKYKKMGTRLGLLFSIWKFNKITKIPKAPFYISTMQYAWTKAIVIVEKKYLFNRESSSTFFYNNKHYVHHWAVLVSLEIVLIPVAIGKKHVPGSYKTSIHDQRKVSNVKNFQEISDIWDNWIKVGVTKVHIRSKVDKWFL